VSGSPRLYPHVVGDAEINDAILRRALSHFSLYEFDSRPVESEHGLSPNLQHSLGVRSASRSACARIFAAHDVAAHFSKPCGYGVPFYREGGSIKLNAPEHGLIVPVVRGGLMRAWLCYRGAKDRAPRWVSSSHLVEGSKVTPSIHVARVPDAEGANRSHVCLIVSHPLEAESVAAGGGLSVVALNGVMPAALVAQLREQWPALAGVTLALDAVSPFLLRALESAGLKVRLA
jgi:hypothetical protein